MSPLVPLGNPIFKRKVLTLTKNPIKLQKDNKLNPSKFLNFMSGFGIQHESKK